MVKLSNNLKAVSSNQSALQMRYYSDDDRFGVSWYWHGVGTVGICFDPWSGSELCFSYDFEIVSNYKRGMKDALRSYRRTKREWHLSFYEENKRCLDKFLKEFGTVKSKKERKCADAEIKRSRSEHMSNYGCKMLLNFLKGGDEEGFTSIIHVPNIRTYAILNKKEYGGFDPMDYCPFCGAKFPQRLDGKLTEILRAEYGLQSWRDYKKAPHEFHTDEWWKKRGL
ncbi:MAG: hypothetical protein IJ599_00040 [Alphaproteobacteria bacterium]|nr:hypothetical protein [Alphaproteobacteria bacterium]